MSTEPPKEPKKEPAKPDYGILKEIVFERTISIRQYEPLRFEFHYTVGTDDCLESTVDTIKKISELIDAKFHPAPPPAPAPAPAQKFLQPQAPKPTPGHAMGFRMPTQMDGETDDEFKGRLIKRCYAIWHNELHEREDMHPKVLGVKDIRSALEYIKEYQGAPA